MSFVTSKKKPYQIIAQSISPAILNLIKNFSGNIRFIEDEEDNLLAFVVVPIDPNSTTSLQLTGSKIGDPASPGNFATIGDFSTDSGGITGKRLNVNSGTYLFNKALATLERARTPSTFKTVQATAVGSTAVWTPAAGLKFRLMGYDIFLGEDASLAAAGVETVQLLDSATILRQYQTQLPAAAVTTDNVPMYISKNFPFNGFLSAAANNVLNISLGTALGTGKISVNVEGDEE